MTTWRFASATDIGLVRDVNEDALHVDARLAVVADGMGGAAAGEVASQLAVDAIVATFSEDATSQGLVRSMVAANAAIMADAKAHPSRTGMGTTAVAIGLTAVVGGVVPVVVNIGDSRAYQMRDGALRRITNDHSVAEEWVRQGRLSPEEAATHPRRHQLTRTLGVEDEVEPDLFPLTVERGDRILLCSDGLSNELSDEEICAIASAPRALDEAVHQLVDQANARGGRDNVTAVLLEFVEEVAQPRAGEAPVVSAVSSPVTNSPQSAAAASPVRRRRVRRPRRLTWRVVVFFVALVAIVTAAYGILDWYSKSSYFLAVDHGHIAVFRGQPRGILWFHPQLVKETEYLVRQLEPGDYLAVIDRTVIEPTAADAERRAQTMHYLWRLGQPESTTTTTTVALAMVGG